MNHDFRANSSFWRSDFGMVCTAVAIAASVYLYVYHEAHVWTLLPYVFLAACPLMHVFMHRGHRHGRPHSSPNAGTHDATAVLDE